MNQYSSSIQKIISNGLYSTFAWMSLGLFITAIVSFVTSMTKFMFYFLHQSMYGFLFQFIIFASQIGLVFAIFRLMNKASYTILRLLFLAFTFCTGLSLSVLFLVYDLQSIIGVFFVTSGMFMALWLYGVSTNKDLTPIKSFVIMLLAGVLIFKFLNMFFFRIFMFDNLLSLVSIFIFSFLTAADIQDIKNKLASYAYDNESQNKIGLIGALIMYQNFINLFLNMLRLLGKQKNR